MEEREAIERARGLNCGQHFCRDTGTSVVCDAEFAGLVGFFREVEFSKIKTTVYNVACSKETTLSQVIVSKTHL